MSTHPAPAFGALAPRLAELSLRDAHRLGRRLEGARKIRKPYMVNCLEAEVVSITTGKPQTLYLDGKDRHLVEYKHSILLDDVISTGSTLRGLRLLMQNAHSPIVAEMAVFTEGNDADWSQVIALGHLPVFTD